MEKIKGCRTFIYSWLYRVLNLSVLKLKNFQYIPLSENKCEKLWKFLINFSVGTKM